MIPLLHRRFRTLLAGLALTLAGTSLHALEHLTLRNGFTLDCSHHAAVGEKVRCFSGLDENNYQELAAPQIESIETLPDLLPQAKPSAAAVVTVSTPTADDMRHLMEHSGSEHNIDVELLAAVIKAESAFNIKAVSRTGARGLMQLMPGTARQLGVQDAFRADQNIAGGTAYLDSLLKLYKDNLALALAAYNAGPGAVARYHGVPPFRETRAYVARVMNEFYRRKTASPTTLASR